MVRELLGWSPDEKTLVSFLIAMGWAEQGEDGLILRGIDCDPMPSYANAAET